MVAMTLTGLQLRRDWPLLAVALPLLIAAVFLIADAMYRQDGTVVYWLAVLYDYTVISLVPLIASVGIAMIFLVAFWLLQVALTRSAAAHPGRARPYALVTMSVLFLCLICSCGPLLLFHDEYASSHLESLQVGAHVYHLAYKPTSGWSYAFVVYECDGTGMLCHVHSRTCAVAEGDSADPIRPAAHLGLDPATGTVSAVVSERVTLACESPGVPYPT